MPPLKRTQKEAPRKTTMKLIKLNITNITTTMKY